ncbi:MAG: tetratricopeptide repeat protein, partial [Gemmatimonadetes bacterium]|nr:tetratricopeptide repeat protein [Gemmatimonadota bacterium]
ILYELLTGFRPRDLVEDGAPRRPSDLITRTEHTVSEARSAEPARLRRRLAGDLDTICLKALRKDPARRYATAGELLDDVRRHREGRPVRARPDTFGYRASRFVRRNRAGVVGTAGAALLVIATAGVYTARLAEERDRAQLAAAEAQEVTEFLEELFEVSDPSESLGRTITAAEVLESGRERLEFELEDQPRVQAALLATIGRVYRNLSLWDEARGPLTRALEIRTAELGPDHPDIAESLRDLADLESRTDGHARADTLYRRALEMGLRLEGADSERHALDVAGLGAVALEAGRLDEADSLLRRALDMQRATHDGDHEDIARTLHTLAAVGYYERDFQAAEPLFRESYEMFSRLHPEGHPAVVRGYDDWGNALASMGEAEEGERVAREVIEMWEELHGPNHPDVALAFHSLGATLQYQGRYDEAIPVYEEGLARLEASVGLDNARAAAIYGNMARTYRLMGRLDDAEAAMLTSIAIDERVFGPDSERLLVPLSMLGNLRADQGRYEEAIAVYERGQRLTEALGEYDRVNYENRALTYRDMGDTTRMMEMYEASVEAVQRIVPDQPLEHVVPMITLGQAQANLGQWDDAAATLGDVYRIRRAELPEDSWFVWNALSLSGWAVLGTDGWRDAEALLLEAYEGLIASDRSAQADVIDLRTRETVERLTWFYEMAENEEERARWQAVFDEMSGGD